MTVAELPVIGFHNLPDRIESDAVNLIERPGGSEFRFEGREYISYSAISALLACDQKYGFSYDLGIEPVTKPTPLVMGTAFQQAIEKGDPNVARDFYTPRIAQAMTLGDADKLRIEQAIVTGAAGAYLDRWGARSTDSIREFGFRVRIRNPWTGAYSRTFDLLGYADELDRDDNGLVLVENKLVGRVDPSKVKGLPLDRQVALEAYGIWRATGEEVRRVKYRWTKKPQIRQRQNESVEEFCRRIKADYAERPDFYLHEEDVPRDPTDLVRVEAELWEWANRIREQRKRRVWARNTNHCSDFGGCQFRPICLGDPDAVSLFQLRSSRRTENQPTQEAATS